MKQEHLQERMKTLKGKIGLYYENLETGEKLSVNGEKVFTAASVIKLPILLSAAKLAAQGDLNLEQKILIRDEDKKPSCGALLSFDGDVEVSIRTLCRLMITLSDNTATNAIIDTIGLSRLQGCFHELGLQKTAIERKLFDDKAAEEGRQNYICPEEIASLLKQVYQRSFVDEKTSEFIEEVLLLQQIRHKIPGYIGRKKKIANKTGEDGNTTHDAAVVFAEKPFILIITADDTDVPETERFMREIALELYRENGGDADADTPEADARVQEEEEAFTYEEKEEIINGISYRRLTGKAKANMRVNTCMLCVPLIILAIICIFTLTDMLWLRIVLACICLIFLADIVIAPKIRYERYRYHIDEESIRVREGLFWISEEIVPIERLHKIEVSQGPVSRAFKLSTVTVTTAGGECKIRFLKEKTAERIAEALKKKINEIVKGERNFQKEK